MGEEDRALRTVGFAAWLRPPAQGFDHDIYAVAIADPDTWQQDGGHIARDQVCSFRRGHNGLAGDGLGNTPSGYRVSFTWWEKCKGIRAFDDVVSRSSCTTCRSGRRHWPSCGASWCRLAAC